MPVWLAVEERLARMPSAHPARLKFLDRVNYFGQVGEFDVQGRVLIPAAAARRRRHDRRRRRARARSSYLEVWNHERFAGQAPARAVHRRRRAGARGVRDLRWVHEPVLVAEVVALLRPRPDGVYVDCTVGLGGHAAALLEAGAGRLIGIDRDAAALALARDRRSRERRSRVELVHADYRDLARGARRRAASSAVAGIVADLGVSSMQLDDAARGFSFRLSGPLDMRMDRSSGPTAAELIASADETTLADVIWRFGEERHVAADRARDRARARSPAADGRRERWRRSSRRGRRTGHGSGSTRRRARFRRCGSG